ncbi:hypothetical protein RJ639_003649 [Escallonia herrerae]|uniref:DNA-directed RNA polymerase n=1 Tax=Escallonia herrerae TaxID=1293975 RepID=A0AA88W4A1_9ASTE|nr:hypothetical protein RJ639_003649 [Escallonia herrerae]
MGTLDDMNHLKNKRIRSIADLLQDQFGLALVHLENVVRGTISGVLRHKLIPLQEKLPSKFTMNLWNMEVLMAERANLVFHNKVIDGTAMKRLIS